MIRKRLPRELDLWLDARGFNYLFPDEPNYLSDDEVYSAAHELYGDMYEGGNLWCEESTSSAKNTVKRFIERESKRCKLLPLGDWYGKGC